MCVCVLYIYTTSTLSICLLNTCIHILPNANNTTISSVITTNKGTCIFSN